MAIRVNRRYRASGGFSATAREVVRPTSFGEGGSLKDCPHDAAVYA